MAKTGINQLKHLKSLVMKTFIIILLCLISHLADAQFSFGVKAGLSPGIQPKTAYKIINRDNPENEFLFNSEIVEYSPVFGIYSRLNVSPFWFSLECLTYSSKEKFSIRYTYQGISALESNTTLVEKKRLLEIPVSVGVTLGKVEIFSGFSLTQTLTSESELDQISGFESNTSNQQLGWHSGVGLNLGRILIDLRYAQAFGNYGQDKSVNGWDLTLKNARSRVVGMIAFHF